MSKGMDGTSVAYILRTPVYCRETTVFCWICGTLHRPLDEVNFPSNQDAASAQPTIGYV